MGEDKKLKGIEVLEKEASDIHDITGNIAGEPIKASHSQKLYFFRPVPLSRIPKLSRLILSIQAFFQDKDITNLNEEDAIKAYEGSTDEEGSIAEDGVLYKMGQIISMGLDHGGNKEIPTVNQILDEFSFGDFPKAFRLSLDMNDFLSGMMKLSREGTMMK